MAKVTRQDIIAAEKAAWEEVVKRLDFLVNVSSTHTSDKALVEDAAGKVSEAIGNFNPLHSQRTLMEFEVKE